MRDFCNKEIEMAKTVCISGGFDPLHVGHLRMIRAAKSIAGAGGKMIVILKNTIDPIWFHNQVEELDFMLNPDSGAGYDLFKPNLEVFDTSTAEGKRDKRRVTNRTGKPVSSSTSESRYSGRPNRY